MSGSIKPCRYWGSYVLLLCLMTEALTTNGQSKKDSVFPKVDSLKAVIVRPKEIRPRIHGDTIEYNTSSIQMRVNANVEELLGRLPGLRIDADGTITYNGEVIKRILVEGEDFFSSDPRLITRNFDASRIAQVQVLDRKSDQTRFSGLDDGSRTKTLNLVLKDDSKMGYFGKVEAGADAQGYYNTDGLLASFRQREQTAALGLASNAGTTSLYNNAGNIFVQNDIEDPLGTSAGKGIPRTSAIAVHYANTWNGTNDHLAADYQYSNLLTHPVTITHTLQTLSDSIYAQQQQSKSTNRQDQHAAFTKYECALDSFTSFSFLFHYINSIGNNQFCDTKLSSFNDTTVNLTERRIQSTNTRDDAGGEINWKIKSRKIKDRIFSIFTSIKSISDGTAGYLHSLTQFYRPNGQLESLDTVDQRKAIKNETNIFNGGVTYTEPLWGRNTLGFQYDISYSGDQSDQSTYNRGDGKYQEFVDSLSSHLIGHTMNQSSSLILQGGSQFRYLIISGLQWYDFQQKDILRDLTSRYHSFNFTPRLLITYTPARTDRIGLDYSRVIQEPSITQLQSVKNNIDPLHILIGNPNLRPGSNHNLKLTFNSIKSWIYNLTMYFGINESSISTKTFTDSLGRQISQPLNVNGGRSLGLSSYLNKKIGGISIGMAAALTYMQNVSYLNEYLSRNDSYTGGGGFSLSKYLADKYSFKLNTRFAYFSNRSKINTNASIHYWTQSHNGSLSLYFIPGIELTTEASYTWQQKTNSFYKKNSVLLWNASILHNFLTNRLVVKLQADNLLDQNSGISRTNSGNINTESTTNILGRYWLISLTYRFDHKYKH